MLESTFAETMTHPFVFLEFISPHVTNEFNKKMLRNLKLKVLLYG